MNDFEAVKVVRNTIMGILKSNGMMLTSRDGEIVIEKLQIKLIDPPVYIGLYE